MDFKVLVPYRDLNFNDPNAIINKGDKGAIVQNGSYTGALSALKRTDVERSQNNLAREQLLKTLANAFGRASEYSKGKDGRLRFDTELLDKLQERLGKAFKFSDFGIDKEGRVTSGKPLTQRRIEAIMQKMSEVAKDHGVDLSTVGLKTDPHDRTKKGAWGLDDELLRQAPKAGKPAHVYPLRGESRALEKTFSALNVQRNDAIHEDFELSRKEVNEKVVAKAFRGDEARVVVENPDAEDVE